MGTAVRRAPPSGTSPARLGGAMELIAGQQAADREQRLVHDWRVSQLTRLGIPGSLAEIYADRIDWHQIPRLVERGFPARPAQAPCLPWALDHGVASGVWGGYTEAERRVLRRTSGQKAAVLLAGPDLH